MIIHLKAQADTGSFNLKVEERVPLQVQTPFSVYLEYQTQAVSDYFLLTYSAASPIQMVCQRCLSAFSYQYQNTLNIALCPSEERANELMEQYECLVIEKQQVDLSTLITDDLHLYLPESHPDPADCDKEVSQFIGRA